MRLDRLVAEGALLRGDGGVDVTALTADSRDVRPGALFAALRGTDRDGFGFVGEALAGGAAALLGDARLAELQPPVPTVVDADPRRQLALMAARFFVRQPARVVAVTGTNGKSSTASFTRQLWAAAGRRAASLGTLGIEAPGRDPGASLTTPDPVRLHKLLAELAEDGIDDLVLEASSHGLDQRRVDGVSFGAAAFLNLTRDHIDYHGSEAAYRAAKWRLFDTLLPTGATAVINADLPISAALLDEAHSLGLEVVDFGVAGRRLRLLEQRPEPVGQSLLLEIDGAKVATSLPVVGAFQAFNLLAAIGLVMATGLTAAAALAGVPRLQPPRGRMQRAGAHPTGAPVFVDYAHTPDALDQALQGLRPHCRGRLAVVFGAGGDRDRGKRPEMGRIAVARADRVIVTDDNPRSEEPARIRAEVLAAAPEAMEIGDRAEAIRAAVRDLQPGDVLLVAGKGHETGQIVGTEVKPFDDVAEVEAALRTLGGAA
ncbi:MAG: UDP-N-acetylmuramoyl-L-alanyl-D-glutamate--2,6-diaminopimelate ligase [Pseudomonadota bacterium]